MWERKDAEIFNWNGELPEIHYTLLKQWLKPDVYLKFEDINHSRISNSIVTKIDQPIVIKRVLKNTESKKSFEPNLSTIKDAIANDKYVELLFNVIKNERDAHGEPKIDFNEWLRIAGICKAYGISKDIFIHWTELCKPTTGKTWDALTKLPNPNVVFGLQSIAKRINPDSYREWLIKHNEYLDLNILERGENDVATFVGKFLISDLVFCRRTWWSFDAPSGLWREIDEPSAKITTFTQLKITEAEQCFTRQTEGCENEKEIKNNMEKKKKYIAHYVAVCKSSFNSQMVKYLKTYLSDEKFIDKLDCGKYRIAFQNGIMDLKTLQFQQSITREDFLTKTIPSSYTAPSNKNVDHVREILKQICNYNDKHLDYYLSTLGYAFTGDCGREQNFWYLRGQTAQNGKSVIFEVLETLMPNYVKKSVSDVLDKGAKVDKEINTWRGVLLLWLNELSTKIKDEDLIKATCDGTNIPYNPLYSKSSVAMPVSFKLFAVSNNTLQIKGDAGVKRRFKLLQFNSQFKEDNATLDYENLQFPKNKNLPEELTTTYANALMHLIFTYSHDYAITQKLKDYPAEWETEKNEVMADSDAFGSWFEEHFETGKDFMTYKEDWDQLFKYDVLVKNLKPKDEFARLKIPCIYDCNKQVYIPIEGTKKSRKTKGYWLGFRRKGSEEQEDDTNDGVTDVSSSN
jgi:phage/plasmid-associated DNA primase